ncbi:hypothetical protein BV898_09256 [Hypsibius exemplaris]|uniref:Chromo domain-containing protein n=1 Tax=Hypsibius exemplaris TaxID=2072580 RepID=A0A1W0WN11_HYPEX|nr:hypothetical protein BV898_09256 [Hypsibius exemplaris]
MSYSAQERRLQEEEKRTGNFTIGEVLGERKHKGVTQYHVKWKYFPLEEATWEPAAQLTGTEPLHEWIAKRGKPRDAPVKSRTRLKTPGNKKKKDDEEAPLRLSSSDDGDDDPRDAAESDDGSFDYEPFIGPSGAGKSGVATGGPPNVQPIAATVIASKGSGNLPTARCSSAVKITREYIQSDVASIDSTDGSAKSVLAVEGDSMGPTKRKGIKSLDGLVCKRVPLPPPPDGIPRKRGRPLKLHPDGLAVETEPGSNRHGESPISTCHRPSGGISGEFGESGKPKMKVKGIRNGATVIRRAVETVKASAVRTSGGGVSSSGKPKKPIVCMRATRPIEPGSSSSVGRLSSRDTRLDGGSCPRSISSGRRSRRQEVMTQTELDDPLAKIIPHGLMCFQEEIDQLRNRANDVVSIIGIVPPLDGVEGEVYGPDDMMVVVLLRNALRTGEEAVLYQKPVVKFVLPLLLIKFYEHYLDLPLSTDIEDPARPFGRDSNHGHSDLLI